MLKGFLLPVIHGFVSSHNCSISGQSFIWSIISRRSTERVGTRLFTRGADVNGHVANFVETEQLVEFKHMETSYVQTRGSIPLFWQQRPNLRYKPPPTLESNRPHSDAFSKHMGAQKSVYGEQIIVNLVDQKKAEGKLEAMFGQVHHRVKMDGVHYEAFDFHKECSKMRWDRLSLLMDRLAKYEDNIGFHFLNKNRSLVLNRQRGVFRTNCIDCLDRTNVVQSLLARRNLNRALVELGVLPDSARIENQVQVEQLFKTVWADHADVISIQYTGTGALKTDFTRTGKRTKLGLLEDGRRSAIRYVKNNFSDGFRQDSLDLFVGNYNVSPTEGVTYQSPLTREPMNPRMLALPIALALSMAMLALSTFLPAQFSTEVLLSLLFWIAMIVFVGYTILKNGRDYVDNPRLIQIAMPSTSSLS